MKKVFSILFAIVLIISCKNNEKPTLVLGDSTGSVKQVLLVMDNDLWKGEVGEALRKIISEPVLGLPQPESQFGITLVPTDAFTGMLKSSRNILYIEKRDSDTFNISENKYSQPQKIISILGKSNKSLIAQLQKNAQKIIKEFAKSDIKVVQKRQKNDERKGETYKTFKKLGISMVIPYTFNTVDDTGNFLWLRHHLTKGRSIELLVYAIPITSKEDELGNTIIENRNTIGKKYIPGEEEGMYMITEKAYTPHRFDAVIDGKKAFETRGKWEMKDDFMAGPFINYTVIDKANNRLIVVEGFVFAPAVNKRNYMFELEAILKTLHIK